MYVDALAQILYARERERNMMSPVNGKQLI